MSQKQPAHPDGSDSAQSAQASGGQRMGASSAGTNRTHRPPPCGQPLRLILGVQLRSAWRRMLDLRGQSRLLVALIGLFLGGYALFAYSLFYFGLRFIARFPGLGPLLVERLLFLLFACLFGLLLVSNLIIAYTNLFRNRETIFLLTCPVPVQTVFQWKLIESTLLASWAFLFLIAPLLLAYGRVHQVDWHFYLMMPVLMGLFIVLPGIAGACLATILARWLDRRTFQVAIVGFVLLMLGSIALQFRAETITDEMLEARVISVIDRLLVNTRFAQFPWLPSYWLSNSVQHWAEGSFRTALFFSLVLTSHALFFTAMASTQTGQLFQAASSAVQSRASVLAGWGWFRRREARRTAQAGALRRYWLGLSSQTSKRISGSESQPPRSNTENTENTKSTEQGLKQAHTFPFPPDRLDCALRWLRLRPTTRALISKDMRVFWRDTAQWGQTILLFGLLAVYISNLRNFTRQLDSPFWIALVSFLNLGACSLNVATLTTRFVFPQFSLEGRRVWLIGMAPVALADVVRLKFRLASLATGIVTLTLTWLSCHLLHMDWVRQIFFCVAVSLMTLTLNAVAVGLGVLYPNFRETQPGKIVSGFGGTFCLVLSFVYIVFSVMLLAFGSPWHWRGDSVSWGRTVAAWGGFLVLTLATGWWPLHLALRRVRVLEI